MFQFERCSVNISLEGSLMKPWGSWLVIQFPLPVILILETQGECWAPPMQGRTGGSPLAGRGDKEHLTVSPGTCQRVDYPTKTGAMKHKGRAC